MLNLRSSQSASATSCTLRESVRSWVRNRFLASCWVSVEPPCDTPRCRMLATERAGDADRIDAVMRIEAPVLDRDECLRHVARQVLERHRGAAHVAAGGEQVALQIDDLDRGRALGDFERLDRRQMGADPHRAADDGDDQPEADDRAPIGHPSDGPSPAAAPPPPLRLRRLRLALAAVAAWHGGARRVRGWRRRRVGRHVEHGFAAFLERSLAFGVPCPPRKPAPAMPRAGSNRRLRGAL